MIDSDGGPITRFPADDLRDAQRFITTHDANGKGIFTTTDHGDHHRVMVQGKGVGNIIYATYDTPVDLTNDVDIELAAEKEPGIHIHNGSIARMVDFAPGVESPLHRAMSIDYGVVIEGEFEMTLDSGESRIMRPGDCSVNRACMHKWRNTSQTRSGRMLYVLLDVKPLLVNGKPVEQDLGDLSGEYADR